MAGRRLIPGLLVAAVLIGATAADAQRRGGRNMIGVATAADYDGDFHFCRVAYGFGGGYGNSWSVDFPRADINLSIRVSELTKTRVSFDEVNEPKHLVIRLTDDALFQCPFVMMTEVGNAYFSDDEAARLRDYVLKGGFVWADDLWGSNAWLHWESQLRKALPSGLYPMTELPLTHTLFRSHFVVQKVPQIPSINYWMGSGGDTSERGYDSATPSARAILDERGRVMVLTTHNTDVGDSWEREGDDPRYFYAFSIDGYAFGVNTVLYSMSH